MTAGGRVKGHIDGRSGNIVEAIREELPIGTDSLVIPAVIVAEHMQNLESTSVWVSSHYPGSLSSKRGAI